MNKVSSTKKKILNKDSIGDSALVNHAEPMEKRKLLVMFSQGSESCERWMDFRCILYVE